MNKYSHGCFDTWHSCSPKRSYKLTAEAGGREVRQRGNRKHEDWIHYSCNGEGQRRKCRGEVRKRSKALRFKVLEGPCFLEPPERTKFLKRVAFTFSYS